MNPTETIKSEAVRQINRNVAKFVAIRIIVPMAVTVAALAISNAIDKKLPDGDIENTESN